MEQLVFDLAPPEPPSFANFLPGRNAEVLAALARFAAGDATTTGILLWGVAGAGDRIPGNGRGGGRRRREFRRTGGRPPGRGRLRRARRGDQRGGPR